MPSRKSRFRPSQGPAALAALALPIALLAGVGACRCGHREEVVGTAPLPHFLEWPKLVDRAVFGDLETARIIASTLTGGPETEREEAAAQAASGRIGAALGFVEFAEDPEELAEAIAAAAAGCGGCHGATGTRTDVPRPPWLHETAADWAVHGLVWNVASSPPGSGEAPLDALAESWGVPIPQDTGLGPADEERRVARLIAACAECHVQGDARDGATRTPLSP